MRGIQRGRSRAFWARGIIVLALSILPSAAEAASTYTYTTIDFPGANSTYLSGINNASQIVGWDNAVAGGGFFYSAGNYTTLIPPLNSTVATSINNLGQIVGFGIGGSNGGDQGFLKPGNNYTTFAVPSAFNSVAEGINDAGQIVGGYNFGNFPNYGFLLGGGVYTTLQVAPGLTTQAQGININGQIVGYYADKGGSSYHGFLYNGAFYTTIDFPGASETYALGINNLGQIVGDYYNGTTHGFLYVSGAFTTLDDPLATGPTVAQGINDAGEIVGWYHDGSGDHGFLATVPYVPFLTFGAKLAINHDLFELKSGFTLGSASNGIHPSTEPVTLQIGSFATTIPPGSFTGTGFGPFNFAGMINGVTLRVRIEPTGAKRYELEAHARDASLTGTVNPVPVTLTVGDDSGRASVMAKIVSGLAVAR